MVVDLVHAQREEVREHDFHDRQETVQRQPDRGAGNPGLACERLEAPGGWLRDKVSSALDGFFARPYLLWFVAEDPVRNGKLPANIAEVAQTIVRSAQRRCADRLGEQLDHLAQIEPIRDFVCEA
jgi:hypothetical protein